MVIERSALEFEGREEGNDRLQRGMRKFFWHDHHVHQIDCGDDFVAGYIYQNIDNYIL